MKRLLVLSSLISALCLAQAKKAPWQEMLYATDGFAITVPYPPLPHADAHVPDTNTYTVYLPEQKDVVLTLRVMHQKRDCKATLEKLRTGMSGSAANTRVDIASIKDVSIDGHPGIEYLWQVDISTTGFDRYYCVNGIFYTFSATWARKMPFPSVVKRIMDSFRLVKQESQ